MTILDGELTRAPWWPVEQFVLPPGAPQPNRKEGTWAPHAVLPPLTEAERREHEDYVLTLRLRRAELNLGTLIEIFENNGGAS